MLDERITRLVIDTADLNEAVYTIMERMNRLNMNVFLASIENDPARLTPEMIADFAEMGLDLTELTPVAKGMVPPCFHKSSGPEDPTEELTSDMKPKSMADYRKSVPKPEKVSAKEKPTKRDTYPSLNGKKIGVIYARCNKDKTIENQVLDRLYDAASDRGIMVVDHIVNQKNGQKLLMEWLVEDPVGYVLMNRIEEYSTDKTEIEKLINTAYVNGVRILIGDKGFASLIPEELY